MDDDKLEKAVLAITEHLNGCTTAKERAEMAGCMAAFSMAVVRAGLGDQAGDNLAASLLFTPFELTDKELKGEDLEFVRKAQG